MKNVYFLLVFAVFVVLFSCKNEDQQKDLHQDSYSPGDVTTTGSYNEEEYSKNEISSLDDLTGGEKDNAYNDYDDPDLPPTTGELTPEEIEKIGKKIIKNADISIELKNYEEGINRIKNTIIKFEGEINNETESNYDNYISNVLVIKVEASKFDSLINEIMKGEGKIVSKNIWVNDVTEEYIDVYQRLKNKKAIEQQYLALLKKAYTVNEILNVTQYLRQIQEEIEASIGRLKYMDDQSQYSTITLRISYTGETIAYKETFWDKVKVGLEAGWQGVVYFVIAIFYIWPIWIIVGIIIFVVRRQMKKKEAEKKQNQ